MLVNRQSFPASWLSVTGTLHFLQTESCSPSPRPIVADPHQNSPTTANVQYYNSFEIENLAKVRFLDLEGENGGKPPRSVISEKLEALLHLIGVSEYQERRRKAVSDHMPRLAFVTSDIVLFIGNESFANAKYFIHGVSITTTVI